jgi:hypothetical protein
MLRRLGALAVAIVLAALPSLNRICLTGCDAEKSTSYADRPGVEASALPERGADSNCPLHASQPLPEPPATPNAPASPSPCRHQPELASVDYAKFFSLALGADQSFTLVTVAAAADPMSAAAGAPNPPRHPIYPRRPSHALVLRI